MCVMSCPRTHFTYAEVLGLDTLPDDMLVGQMRRQLLEKGRVFKGVDADVQASHHPHHVRLEL